MDRVPDIVPDFCIVGAPKCGTTSLYAYLATHPGVAMSSRKEPFFWCTDVRNRGKVTAAAEYEQLWDGAAPHALKGEATTGYARSLVAIPAILAARPEARFILLLRRPVDMARAFHSELVKRFQEDVGRFEKAWRLQPVRRAGRRIPPGALDPNNIQYEWVCALGDQLERFLGWVPERQRLVILFDEFADPRAVYLRTLHFLGLPDDGRDEFPRLNENRTLRSPRVARFQQHMPQHFGRFYAPLRAAANRIGISPSTILHHLNVRDAPRRPLRRSFELELLETFRPQVRKIETLLGLDLSHWNRPQPRP